MPRLNAPTAEGIAALLPYFNNLLGAVEEGATVGDLWAAYKQAVQIAGGALGNPSIFDMNFIAAQARNIVASEGSLARAELGQAVDSTMWAWAPWAAGDTGAYLTENFMVQYQANLSGPGGDLVPVWGMTDWQGSLEGLTKEQLLGRATTSAQEALDTGSPGVQAQLGMAEGFSFSGITRVKILRV